MDPVSPRRRARRHTQRRGHGPVAGAVVAAMLVLSACGTAGSEPGDDPVDDPIVVGALIPATGLSAQLGIEARLGVEMAISEINAAGGVSGRELELKVADSQGDPTVGVNEARRLIERENIDVLVGPTYSQVTLAVQPQLNQAQIPSINVSGTEELTTEVAPFSFSFLVNASSQAKTMVSYAIESLGAQTVAILRDNGDQAKSAVSAMKDELSAADVEVVGEQEYEYGASDMTPQILDLRRQNPDALLLFSSTGDDTGSFLKSREEAGWDVPVVGSYGAALADPAIEIAGVDGYSGVVGTTYEWLSTCADGSVPEGTDEFLTNLKDYAPDAEVSAAYVSIWYDAVYLLKAAIEGAESTEAPDVASWIEEHNAEFAKVGRDLSASDTNHFLIGAANLAVVHPADRGPEGLQRRAVCEG